MVILFEQSIVFNCPLLELHVYTAAIDADDTPDPTDGGAAVIRQESYDHLDICICNTKLKHDLQLNLTSQNVHCEEGLFLGLNSKLRYENV